ncbi:CNOT10 [Cordylochernes scorpioides]|uniref:CCR4-NOT transcription complex subunit 10 n=1 Tax=Cordylochernes scorpioides TaxID=51811 RepID=A0ABY6K6U6_9ARAC|nr:CNOT10 [Cordylochernes scorpioides]
MSGASKPCTDEEKELASLAHEEFSNENYDACLDYLNKLLAKRPNDLKVQHNKAVAQFYSSKQRKIVELRDQINHLCTKANLSTENLDGMDDAEHAALLYNKAVLFFHNHQHQAALTITQKLWQFVESFTEDLARKVSYLLIELYISTNQAEKAMNLIQCLEKLLSQDSKDGEEKGAEKEDATNDAYKSKLTYYKARCYLLLKSTKACKREVKQLANQGEGSSGVYIRSQLDYLRGNYRKALKVLNTSISNTNQQQMREKFEETGDMYTVLYLMNLANIHFKMDKPYLACLYNHKAHTEHLILMEKLKKEDKNSLVLWTHNVSLQYKIKYNSAIFFLHTKRPVEAFDWFLHASHFFHTNPRVWLHLAESCIYKHQPDNSQQFNIQACKNLMVKGQVGSGQQHKLLLSSPQPRTSAESSAIPLPTLEFASICLRNAYLLLDSSGSNDESLRNAILLASAYVALCIGDVYIAANQAETLLAQSNLSGVQQFLGLQYRAEALIHKDDVSGAVQLLDPDQLSSFEAPAGWYPRSESTARVVMRYNQALAYSINGESDKASENLRQVGTAKGPDTDVPIQAILLALYQHLQQGHGDLARNIIKQYLPQYR